MKVSIVVPTYNQGPYIRECLLSIQNQTHRDLEIIIQDSLSGDGTEQICREFVVADPRFQYFREKDSGQSDAINRGLARSTGELWTWLCSDDLYGSLEALNALVKGFAEAHKRDPNYAGVYGEAVFVHENGDYAGKYQHKTTDLFRQDFKLDWPLSQPSTLVLTDRVKKIKGVEASLYLGMDLDLFIRFLEGDRKLAYVPQWVASVRLQPNSKSLLFRKKTAENAIQIITKHFGDSGGPHASAYAREYGIASRQELLSRGFNWLKKNVLSYIPLPRKWIGTLRKRAFYIMDGNQREIHNLRGPSVFAFRLVWGAYRNTRHVLFIALRPLNWVYETTVRTKHHHIKRKH